MHIVDKPIPAPGGVGIGRNLTVEDWRRSIFDGLADTDWVLASWLSVLKVDKKAIFAAASKASRAAAFLAALQGA